MDPGSMILGYAIRFGAVILLVLANGFFVAAEFALVGVRRSRIQTLATSGNRRAQRLLGMLDQLDAYISATQFGITIASLALGWVGESTLAHLFEPVLLRLLPEAAAATAAHTAAIAISFALITFLHIVLGELAPKTLALQRAEAVALAVGQPMKLFYRIFKAPIWLLNETGNIVVRLIGLEATASHASIYTAEELHHLIDQSSKGGQIKQSQGAILSRALEFTGLTVRYAMIPRTAVEAVSDQAPLDEIIRRIHDSGYSRLPVYRETLDNIVGVIHSKEVIAFWDNREDFQTDKVMHPVNFVPDTMRLDAVLKRMQEGRFHFAVVTDEHGGFEGIITLEDLLEEIVGEIEDEFDDEAQRLVQKLPDGSYLLEGTLPIRSANRRLGLSLPEDGVYHTLAGFLMTQAGRVLQQGDQVDYGDANSRSRRRIGTAFAPSK
jgi:CBS domain containing-hemolysin-like protein